MYKRFAFEGDIHDTLECVPLAVRRKLDLAALKISLAGWQELTRSERLSLCHLAVDSVDDLHVYREVLRAFCDRASVPLRALDDPNASARAWNAASVPAQVAVRVTELGGSLGETAWHELDEETRYALLKLADPKRNPLKIHALLVELGLLTGPAPVIRPTAVVCAPEPAQQT